MEQTADTAEPDTDAERVKIFGAALQTLAEDFDGTGQEADFENLTAFLKSRADFNALKVSLDRNALGAFVMAGTTEDTEGNRIPFTVTWTEGEDIQAADFISAELTEEHMLPIR